MKADSVVIIKNDLETVLTLPQFGEIIIKIQNGNPVFVSSTEQIKL
ncbi:hypothetical protein HCA15_03695 [Listeria booriae]|nr:hypothetical protein [Listeria booriae]MBC6165740.1 hypothetical protein [Listeria booriae]